ncbi:hypothetical protein PR003_g5030 [Phytophthora rubi]|uniref:Uncharacterized protein n=1 Tax=Phytophthora rubi TaxID=129364 RepID=A0A6A3IR93_9STRA|nr:hypothetical protein PR002_g23307 [Phytophthora rubi]KAE8984982.1 hypothetical protein PR001_g23022 [Phytophthora rubi]KAE9351126.1 hypothetical protein PR003_g5030 [Phytophthora rubi]
MGDGVADNGATGSPQRRFQHTAGANARAGELGGATELQTDRMLFLKQAARESTLLLAVALVAREGRVQEGG